jgi:ABC-2 type transport system permease protein
MKLFREIGLYTFRCIKACLRNPVFLFMGVITPVLYLTLFTPLLGTLAAKGSLATNNVLTLFVPGMLPIIAFSTGMFTGFGMIDDVRSGMIERFRVTPTSRFAILSGPVLFDVCSVFFQSTLFTLIALPFGFRAHFGGILVLFILLALLTIITSSFGNVMGVILKNEDRYAPLIHGIHLPILLLSGTLLPMSLAPGWLNVLAHCNPVFYVVEASRALALGDFQSLSILYAFCILIPFALFMLFWGANVFKKVVT